MTDSKNENVAQIQHDEGKGDIQMLEMDRAISPGLAMKNGALQDAEARGQQESGYEGLGAWETIKKFRRVSLYMFLVTFAAATDGYQVSLPATLYKTSAHYLQDRNQRQHYCQLWVSEAIRYNHQFGWRTSFISIRPHCYRYDPVSRSDYRHGLYAFVSTTFFHTVIYRLADPSLAAKFGRKWGFYVLWLFLVVSVTLEVVARRWEVWVSAVVRSQVTDDLVRGQIVLRNGRW